MSIPVQIHFHGLDASPAMEQLLREKIEALAHLEPRATSCLVVIEPSDHRHRHGTLHRVTLRLSIPGDELVVSGEGDGDPAHEDPYVAVRDACYALRRQLVERSRIHRASERRP